jgi:hypothetical protein
VDYVIGHHEERLAEVRRVVAEGDGSTCWDIATRLTWSRSWEEIPAHMRRAANNETLAHLVWLEQRDMVTRVPGEPDLWYAPSA